MMKSFLGGVSIVVLAAQIAPANAQSTMLQAGPWTSGHSPIYSGSGTSQPVVTDSGTAAGGAIGKNLSEIGITSRSPTNTYPSANSGSGQFYTHSCMYDGPTTNATGYHYLCFDPNAMGGGLIAYGANGGAANLPMQMMLNGTLYPFPFVLSGTGVIGPVSTTTGNVAVWNNSTGTLLGAGTAIGTSGATIPLNSTNNVESGQWTFSVPPLGISAFNVKNYGAVGSGSLRTASTALGVSSVAGLAAYVANDGSTPYAWVTTGADPAGTTNGYPYGTLFNLPISTYSAANATTLYFGVTQTVGETQPAGATASSTTSLTVNNYGLTAGVTHCTGGCSGSPTVSAFTSAGVTVSSNQTFANGTLLTFNVGPVYGGYAVFLSNTTGVYQGMSVTGTGVSAGTYVEHVNYSSGEVRFNKTVTSVAGTTLTFVEPWLANVVSGMKVYAGTGTGAGTVSAVNTSTGTVTLSASTLPALYPVTPTWATSNKRAVGNSTTFFSPLTNTQAANLSMDWLSIEAAIQAANTAGGGKVYVPTGLYTVNQPIVLPMSTNVAGIGQTGVSLEGDGRNLSLIQTATDFGPGTFLLGSGDPSGTWDNGRGLYSQTAWASWGWTQGLGLQFSGASMPAVGARPQTSGNVPVNMSGLRQASRRSYADININYFNHGWDATGCHGTMRDIWAQYNFDGYYQMPSSLCEFDISMYSVWFLNSGWAGWAIDPYGVSAHFNLDKPYLGYNPYAVYFESGYDTQPIFNQTAWENYPLADTIADYFDAESNACGAIVDGNAHPNNQATGSIRGMTSVSLRAPYVNTASSTPPQGGCPAHVAHVVMQTIAGLTISDINMFDPNDWGPISGGQGMIEASNFDGGTQNWGGTTISGTGVSTLLAQYGSSCQELVTSGAAADTGLQGVNSPQAFINGVAKVKIELPGQWVGRLAAFADSGDSTLAPGTLLEGVQQYGTSLMGVERAGQHSVGGAPLLGVSLGDYNACNMNGKNIPVATSGVNVPVLVPAAVLTTTSGSGTSTTTLNVVSGSGILPGMSVYLGGSPYVAGVVQSVAGNVVTTAFNVSYTSGQAAALQFDTATMLQASTSTYGQAAYCSNSATVCPSNYVGALTYANGGNYFMQMVPR